jgi:ATP-dependent DNA helicase RecG
METTTKVAEALREGEGETVEFKLKLDGEAAADICAMANHRGGLLLIGVDDRGRVVGAPEDSMEKFNSILGSIFPKPEVSAEWVSLGGKILAISVKPSEAVHRFGNDVYLRIGSSNRKASPEEVAALYAERGGLRFDEAVRRDLGMEILSPALVRKFVNLAVERGRMPQEVATWEYTEVLRALKAAFGSPTNAGVLIFSEDPARYIPGADVRVVVWGGEGRVIDDKWFSAPLWTLVPQVVDYLYRGPLRIGWEVKGGTRRELPTIPVEALREAVVNAVVHRNYLAPGRTVVEVTPEKVTVENPGGFPPGVTPDMPFSKPRNPVLADLMYRVGMVEEMGSGIKRMRKICQASGITFRFEEWALGVTRVSFSRASNDLEAKVIRALSRGPLPTGVLLKEVGISRPTLLQILKSLEKKGVIKAVGRTRDRRYQLL